MGPFFVVATHLSGVHLVQSGKWARGEEGKVAASEAPRSRGWKPTAKGQSRPPGWRVPCRLQTAGSTGAAGSLHLLTCPHDTRRGRARSSSVRRRLGRDASVATCSALSAVARGHGGLLLSPIGRRHQLVLLLASYLFRSFSVRLVWRHQDYWPVAPQ